MEAKSVIKHFILAGALMALAGVVRAENCDTDCHERCRVKTDFPPVEFIEPTCHASCEAAKQLACATGTQVPSIPTPLDWIKQGSIATCESVFQGVTNAVIAQCSNWDGRLDNQDLIDQSIRDLAGSGLFGDAEFAGVQVRWCPAINGEGLAADRGRIYLDPSYKTTSRIERAKLLVHEMTHIRQYRQQGTDQFKCNYSRGYLECGGCQDRRHPLEREAYDAADAAVPRLTQYIESQARGMNPGTTPPQPPMPAVPPPATVCITGPYSWCPLGMPLVPGTPCVCFTMYGNYPGVAR